MIFTSGFYEFKGQTLKLFKHQESDIVDVYSDDGIAHSKIYLDISNKKHFILVEQKPIYEDDITPFIIEGFDTYTLRTFDSNEPIGTIQCIAICDDAEPIAIFTFTVDDPIQQYMLGETLLYSATVTIKIPTPDLIKIPYTNFYFIPKA